MGPTVIPYGVGKGDSDRGVVQIPLEFTVSETVEFIKAIVTREQPLDSQPDELLPSSTPARELHEEDQAYEPQLGSKG